MASQRGTDIDGEAAGDFSGRAVSVSSDGSIVAIGASGNDGNGSNSGSVRVYAWNGSAWAQRGADIDGEAAGDESGSSVSVSSDGSIVAIGAPYNNGASGSDSGSVRVYAWNGTSWAQRGADIDGEAAGDESGTSVSVSSDGSIVAIGALFNDDNGSNSGSVRVYAWNGSAWAQRGADINGEAATDYAGWAVSMSGDGSIVAIGAPNNDGTGGADRGHVRVYALTSEPGAPTGVTGTAGNGQVEVSWSAPASTGGATIIAYTVTASPGGRSCSWTTGPLSCTVTGLTNETAYTFTVAAINAVGTGSASSASSAVTPRSGAALGDAQPGPVPAPTVSVTATTPTSIRWSKPSKGQPTVATFDAAPQTTYSISATLTSPARAAKKARGSCTIATGKATCRIRLTTKGRWVVAITPSTGGVTGKPAEKTIRV
ncbi:MAG: fibronectin type III domain-containing protein [Actinomycetota bacterium]